MRDRKGDIYRVRDKMGRGEGERGPAMNRESMRYTLRRGPIEFFFFSVAVELTSCFNSGRTRQVKTVPVSLHQHSRQRQTSAQLGKSNLTHLWIPFNVYASTDGEILLQCK